MPSLVWVVVACLLGGVLTVDPTIQPVLNNENPCNKSQTVNLLVMAPFPSTIGLDPGEILGPDVVPASVLAANSVNARCDVMGDYKIQLVVADSGCNIITKAIASLVDIVFSPQYQVVGVVGPHCSMRAIEIGELLAFPDIDLLQISSATTPILLNHTRFPNTFRELGSNKLFLTMYLDLLKAFKVKKIAIFFDHVNSVEAMAANRFHLDIIQDIVDAEVTVLGMSNFFIPLDQIRNRFRWVFVFGGEEIAREFLCLAFHKGMIYPDYQFIFREISLEDLLRVDVSVSVGGTTYKCKGGVGETRNASIGTMLSLERLIRTNPFDILVDGKDTLNFYELYSFARPEYAKITGFVLPPFQEVDQYQTVYYDSVWAYALALNASIPRFESELGASLSDYTYGHPNMTNILRSELLKVEFNGTRGTVLFDEETFDGKNVTVINIINVVDSNEQKVIVVNYSVDASINVLDRSSFISDSFHLVIVAPAVSAEVVVLLMVVLTAIALVVFHIINLKWTDVQAIKVTSPFLNNLIFSGCYIYLISILFLSFKRTTGSANPVLFGVKCSSFIWCETIAFSLIFGTVCVKTWRILRIFSTSSAKVISHLDNHFLVLYVSILVAIDVFFNILWNVLDPWFMREHIGDRQLRLICNCGHLSIWISTLLLQKALLTIVVLYLSMATRQVPKKEYKQTKSTNMLVYIFILLNSLLVPVFLLLLNSESELNETVSYLSICLKNILCVIMCIVLIFLPPVLPSLRKKWKTLRSGRP
jgi:hypothetical protein